MTPQTHLFGPFVRRFLLEEVMGQRNLSRNTQRSYRDTIRLLFGFLAEHDRTRPTQATVEQITGPVVQAFLAYLKAQRENTAATCNQRLAALHSLFGFISRQAPELVAQATQVCAVAPGRTSIPTMAYLDKPELDALLAAPDRRRPQGRRDYALLLFLYNTGARASEAAGVSMADLDLDKLTVRLLGKGRKIRVCPLWMHTADAVRPILRADGPQEARVFLNVRGQPITRYGIHALVARTVKKAAKTMPTLQKKRVSPHTLRHTTAVHLLQAGVDINTIRAWLGHASLETTNRYAEINMQMKAAALEACAVRDAPTHPGDDKPNWRDNNAIMEFLVTL
jgi:site-specific recombinase XerD